MTTKKIENIWEESDKKNLKKRPQERLTCCKCKNQTFLIVYGVSDWPYYDLFCSKCGSGYPLKIGK